MSKHLKIKVNRNKPQLGSEHIIIPKEDNLSSNQINGIEFKRREPTINFIYRGSLKECMK